MLIYGRYIHLFVGIFIVAVLHLHTVKFAFAKADESVKN